MLHPQTEENLDSVDAAFFTGDPAENFDRLAFFVGRWLRALKNAHERIEEFPEDCEPTTLEIDWADAASITELGNRNKA